MDTIVVYIENENKHIDFIKSLNLLNIPHHRLFEGEKWLGLFHKIQIYLDGLKEIDNEWVILSDARDVLFYKDIETINNVYTKYYSNYDIIVQAEDYEQGCDGFKPYYKKGLKRFEFGDDEFKYVCSGLIMGKRTILIEFFTELLNYQNNGELWGPTSPALLGVWPIYLIILDWTWSVDCFNKWQRIAF